MKMYVANTDNAWFDFLKANQPHEEINFWKPSQQLFKAVEEGELFVFRLKSPRNVIGGYGILASSVNAPIRMAWDGFGIGNGLTSLNSMVEAINRYRKSRDTNVDSMIGCRVLVNPVFFDESEWFDVPSDWSNNIVTGKVYDTDNPIGKKLYADIQDRTPLYTTFQRDKDDFAGMSENGQLRHYAPRIITPRAGQGTFRLKVASAYRFCCAISDTRVTPALDAAHIRPYSDEGSHRTDNGLYLRKDIHAVMDAGFATIDEDFRFVVSDQVKHVFNNGNEYRKLHGNKIHLPENKVHWPSRQNVEWHRTNCYRG